MAYYHPTEEMLLAYATGAQNAATSLLVACHLTYCPQCRKSTAFFDAVGGALLEQGMPSEIEDSDGVLVRVRVPAPPAGATAHAELVDDDMILPRPLRLLTGCAAANLPWRRIITGISEVPLDFGGGAQARLMRIQPDHGIPRHTHEGTEATLVLDGAFSDAAGHYECGDVALADGTVDHRPIADPGPACICLAVTDAPLRFTGILGRVAAFFGKT